MVDWQVVRSEFAWEGSWRDICVPDSTLAEWTLLYAALRSSGLALTISENGTPVPLPDTIVGVFELSGKASYLLSVFAGDVMLNCHFFDPSEIEFDLDPRQVRGQLEFDALVAFMSLVAETTRKVVLMTPENMHEAPFIRVDPSGKCDYYSSGCFFEDLARLHAR